MSLFKKPYEREAKKTLNVLIYGRPGIGKTTLACSAPGAFLIDLDHGIDRVNAQYQAGNIFEPTYWEELQQAVNELAQTPEAKTIVIDTIGKLLDLAVDYVRRTRPTMIQNDGTPSIKGYGVRNQLFKEFLASVNSIGKSVIFVSHEAEDKQKIGREEISTMRPNITGGNRNEVIQDLDMMGYMASVNGIRTITFDQNDSILAKNSRNIHGRWNQISKTYEPIAIPMLDGNTPNNFLDELLFKGNEKFLNERRESMEDYNNVMEIIVNMIDECTDADSLNDVMHKIKAPDFEHKYDSKARAALEMCRRAKELNLTFNKETKQYETLQD